MESELLWMLILLLSLCCYLVVSKHWQKFFHILCIGGIVVVGWRREGYMLMEKVSVAFCFLVITFMLGMWRMHGLLA